MNKKLKLEELNRISLEQYKSIKKNSIVVILDNIRSLHNVGSFFRTCDAFAIEKLILTGITATPPHKEIRKTALGASESVAWSYEKDCVRVVKDYKSLGYQPWAIEQTKNSIPLHEFNNISQPLILVFGNEVEGVNQEVIDICNGSIEIPQFGTKHSLNVSVSGGIVLWEIIKKTS
jgi:tRNA G18 (ribose-2'-O)-methylase SpoU